MYIEVTVTEDSQPDHVVSSESKRCLFFEFTHSLIFELCEVLIKFCERISLSKNA